MRGDLLLMIVPALLLACGCGGDVCDDPGRQWGRHVAALKQDFQSGERFGNHLFVSE